MFGVILPLIAGCVYTYTVANRIIVKRNETTGLPCCCSNTILQPQFDLFVITTHGLRTVMPWATPSSATDCLSLRVQPVQVQEHIALPLIDELTGQVRSGHWFSTVNGHGNVYQRPRASCVHLSVREFALLQRVSLGSLLYVWY